MRIKFFLFLSLYLFVSCIEEYDIDIKDIDDYYLIYALIDNQDSMHRISISRANAEYIDNKEDTIHDVTVSITDDCGNIYNFDDCTTLHYDTIEERNAWEEGYIEYHHYCLYCTSKYYNPGQCFLITQKFEPYHSYTLNVTIGDREYTSTQYMNPSPKINGIGAKKYKTIDDESYKPIFYLIDTQPDTVNYFLIESLDVGYNYYLPLSLFCDKNLLDTINGIEVSIGMGARPDQKFSGMIYGSGYDIYTISKENYEYYSAMEKQITGDGGVYRPIPPTPVTNIKGYHVQGQFVAASIVSIRLSDLNNGTLEWRGNDEFLRR